MFPSNPSILSLKPETVKINIQQIDTLFGSQNHKSLDHRNPQSLAQNIRDLYKLFGDIVPWESYRNLTQLHPYSLFQKWTLLKQSIPISDQVLVSNPLILELSSNTIVQRAKHILYLFPSSCLTTKHAHLFHRMLDMEILPF